MGKKYHRCQRNLRLFETRSNQEVLVVQLVVSVGTEGGGEHPPGGRGGPLLSVLVGDSVDSSEC